MRAHRRSTGHVSFLANVVWEVLLTRGYIDTLEAYIDKYTSLVPFLADDATGTPPSDPAPAEQLSKAISMQASGVAKLFEWELC
jgi:hypothetical protein